MIRCPEERPTRSEREAGPVREFDPSNRDTIDAFRRPTDCVPSETAEREDGSCLGEQSQFPVEEGDASVAFLIRGPVVGRYAAHGRGEIEIRIVEPVPPMRRTGLIGETGCVKRSDQETGRSVPRKHAAGSIRSVRRRCESDHD
jgi:hypothetical protein